MECNQPCQDFCKWIESLPYHQKYVLWKKDYPHMPQCFKLTLLGESVPGSKRQFRGVYEAHVHEFDDRWVLHRDKVNADVNPLNHLFNDAPEYVLSAVVGLVTSLLARNQKDRKNALLAGWAVSAFMLLLGKMGKSIDEDEREFEADAPRWS